MTKIEMKSKGAALRSSEKKHRRLFSAAVVLLVCCLAFVGAVGAAEFSGGSGTKDEPYQIKTIGDFNNITFGSGKNTHYKLMNDLDFGYDAPNEFGTDDKIFYGVFDGNGKTISNISFSTNTPGEISLFGRALSSAKISNLSVANVSVTVGEDVYHLRCGTITNLIQGNGTNCTVRNVTVTINPGDTVTENWIGPVGGIFGNTIENGGQVSNCSIEDFTVIVNKSGNGVPLTMEGVGGISAQIRNATVTGCSVDNFVVRSPYIEIGYLGGIFGRVTGTGKEDIGIVSYGIVYDCHVGNVDASQVKDVSVLHDPDRDYSPTYGVSYGILTESGNNVVGSVNIAGVTGWALTADTQWHNKNDDSFEISTAEELAGLAKLVNLGYTFRGKTVVLINDIDLENKEWTPIGKTSGKSFQGIFDGGWHTISNMMITGSSTNVGLFGYTKSGEVKNLTLKDTKVSGSTNVGTISGYPHNSQYTNILLTGHVEINGLEYVGGMFGKGLYANADNLTIDVDETSYVNANSIEYIPESIYADEFGYVHYRTYVGGIIGFMGEGKHTVSNVTSNINVIGTTSDVGGITGIAHYENSFINCICTGDVTLTSAENIENAQEIGGIAGVWHNADRDGYPVTFQNCKFSGNLYSKYVDGDGTDAYIIEFPNGGITGKHYNNSDAATGILEFIDIKLKEPTPRIGYTFLGWKKSDTETVQSPVTLNITKDNPLTEVWKKNNYTITFKDGDTQITILEFEYESSVTAPANPTKDGYIFKGWSPELPETMPDKDITVSAVWEMIPEEPTDEDETNHVIIITPPKTAWQVVFYPNGGEGNMNAEVFVEGEEEALPKNSFYRDGYVFKGWSLTPEGEVFYIDEETVVIDKTTYLYAVWEKIPDTPQTPEKPNIPTIPIIIAGIIVGLLVMIFVITRKRQKEE